MFLLPELLRVRLPTEIIQVIEDGCLSISETKQNLHLQQRKLCDRMYGFEIGLCIGSNHQVKVFQ